MAIDQYLVGNDGNISFSVGGTSQPFMKVSSFTANLSRNVQVLTGFGDTGGRRRLGMLDLTGTVQGSAGVGITSISTSTASIYSNDFRNPATNATNSLADVTLTLYDDSASTNDAKIVATPSSSVI